jgi:hypothetical protein
MAHYFDELVTGLAEGRSRREMLKLAGATLMGLGTAIAFWRPKAVLAQGNSECAHFCNEVFPPGPERGKCKSDAAHGIGLCIECEADPERVCGEDGDLFCCGFGEICVTINDESVCVPVGS